MYIIVVQYSAQSAYSLRAVFRKIGGITQLFIKLYSFVVIKKQRCKEQEIFYRRTTCLMIRFMSQCGSVVGAVSVGGDDVNHTILQK